MSRTVLLSLYRVCRYEKFIFRFYILFSNLAFPSSMSYCDYKSSLHFHWYHFSTNKQRTRSGHFFDIISTWKPTSFLEDIFNFCYSIIYCLSMSSKCWHRILPPIFENIAQFTLRFSAGNVQLLQFDYLLFVHAFEMFPPPFFVQFLKNITQTTLRFSAGNVQLLLFTACSSVGVV